MFTTNRFLSVLAFSGLFLLGSSHSSATTYYVSTSGNNAKMGTSEALAWRTIYKAAQSVKAGDMIYVKAGLYQETVDVTFYNQGTAALPIILEGYKDMPGDRPTYPEYVPGGALDPTEIPVLQCSTEVGILLRIKSYITIRNIGVSGGTYPIYVDRSPYTTLINVFAINGVEVGLCFYESSNSTVQNCVSSDNWMMNIQLTGRTHNTTVENCRTYSTIPASASSTDYHIYVEDGHDNRVRGCTARNLHPGPGDSDPFPGHGIGIKDGRGGTVYFNPHSYGNIIENCVAYDMGEYLFISHEAYNNSIINCKGYGDYANQNSWSQGIEIRDGAHDNIVSNCWMEGAQTSVYFADLSEGPTTAQISYNNTIKNCVFANSNCAITLWNANNNTIKNCVFNNCSGGSYGTFFYFPGVGANTGNTIRNTIVTNNPGTYQSGSGAFGITYSDFWANNWPMPAGTENIAVNPLYADVANKDFHLKSTGGRWNPATSTWVIDTVSSPCIDAGDPTDVYSTEPAINGGRINMGAYGNTIEASKTARGTPSRPPTRAPYVPPRRR